MNKLPAERNKESWSFLSILELIVIISAPIILLFLPFHFTLKNLPAFENLTLKKGVLAKVWKCKERNCASIRVSEAEKRDEYIDIPINKDIPRMEDEIGNSIEIRYLPKSSGEIDIWHIATNSRVYLKYEDKLERERAEKFTFRNICLLELLMTVIAFLSNFGSFTNYVSKLPERHNPPFPSLEEEITFKPCKFYSGFACYLLSLVTLMALYLGFYEYSFFLVIGIPLAISILLIYINMQKNIHSITLSQEGINSEILRKKIYNNTLEWKDVDKIRVYDLDGGTIVTITALISNIRYKIHLNIFNFENSYYLKEVLLYRYHAYKP